MPDPPSHEIPMLGLQAKWGANALLKFDTLQMKPKAQAVVEKGSASSASRTIFHINGLWVSYAHTICCGAAFLSALVVGCLLHYSKIVQNEYYGYPDEWFPSVSATIGDRYPERSIYQIFIAITSGPRFLLVGLTYLLTAQPGAFAPKALFVVGILRTLTCGGWTYITSTDDHDWHDIFMIAYMVLTIPYTAVRTALTPKGTKARSYRLYTASAFFGTIVPLVYFFIQHKVHRIAGAYTIYAFFEWALIVLDVAFDAGTVHDFGGLEISVVDLNGSAKSVTNIDLLRYPDKLKRGPSSLGFFVAVFNWFVFWSVLTSLGVVVWYFPLWYMGISGYEAFLLSIVSPVILVVPPIRRLLFAYPQIATIGTAIGVGAYWAAKPTDRILYVAAGCASAALSLAISFTLSASRPGGAIYQGSAFVLGLMLSAVAKLYLWTNNPIWPVMNDKNGGLNAWGLALAIGGGVVATMTIPAGAQDSNSETPKATKSESSLAAGLGVGALLFALETWLSDTSLLPLWVWEGYPIRGPTPLPHGLVTLFTMGAGLYVGLTRPSLVLSTKALVVANIGTIGILFFKHWIGYAGGLVLSAHLCAITPTLLEAAGRHSPVKSFGVALTVLALFILAETWTVAYAFVPGGPALRERTWLVMSLNQLLIAVGVWNAGKVQQQLKSTAAASTETLKKVLKLTAYGLTLILALGTIITAQRLQHVVPAPVHAQDKVLTAGIWTVHFGLDNDMWASEVRMRDLIDEAEIDVIGLLESDTQRVIGGHRDMTQRIAEELGFYVDYGPGPNKHTWGAALLSRFPILNSTHHLTPSPVGELAPAIHATLDVYGQPVDVVVFHSGQEEDVEDRRLQTLTLSEIMGGSQNPTILLSYLVTKPLEGNYNVHVSEVTGMHDIDPSDWDRWCEYILYKGIKRVGYARISRADITDTELQVGKFVVGEAPNYSNEFIDESQVPEGRRFPQIFRGQGVRGHRYHVFDEPRYFS